MVGSVSAKTNSTTLWEATYDSTIMLNASTVETFVGGDVLRIHLSLTEASNFCISYKSEANNWSDTAIPSVDNMWPWIETTGDTYYDVTFTDADITALSGQNIYISKGENSTITKIELIHTFTPSAETVILNEDWTASWTAKAFGAQSDAKIGDVIQIQYTAYKDESTDWPWVQFQFMDASENDLVTKVAESKQKNSVTTFEYEITDAVVLEKIRSGGFKVKGDQFILTSVKLLTYSDSYDAVAVTIGSDGIATWSHSKNLDFADTGITAYYCSSYTTGSITLTSIATTWNYCGYILKGNAGTYTVKVVADSEASYPSATWLQGHVGSGTVGVTETRKINDADATCYNYIFSKKKDDSDGSTIGFYRLNVEHNLGANKAYLSVPEVITPTSAQVALIFDDGETTYISNLNINTQRQSTDTQRYNLAGQKVSDSYKGIVIKNGKKYINK